VCGIDKASELPKVASASIVFITPEQSSSEDVRTALVAQKKFIKLLVIDEAHCIQEAS